MHPLIAATTAHRLDQRRPGDDDFGLDPGRAVGRSVAEHRPDVVFLTSPNNPTGTALPLARHRGGLRRGARHGGGRRGVRRVRPRRHAERARPCCRATRGWWSPAPCPRRSRWPAPGSATWPPTRRWSTRCSWSGCPYHLSALTQAVARAALAHAAEPLATVAALAGRTRRRWSAGCGRGASRWPTRTPTSCCSASSPTRHAVWQALLDRGVLIREVGPPGWLRVTRRHPGGDGRRSARRCSD